MNHTEKLAALILQNLRENPDGFTIDVNGVSQTGKKAYALSPYKKYEMRLTIGDKQAGAPLIEAWLTEVSHLLPYPFGLVHLNTDHCIGGWLHEGKIYLDVISLVPKSLPWGEVHKLAKQHEQIAFFDLETLTTINTKTIASENEQ